MKKQTTSAHIADNDRSADEVVADAAFAMLPTLGPIAWLYARTQDRRSHSLADLDWAVMPPLVLEQCRLFMKGKMPIAFITWATVNEEVHQRLMAGNGRLAPHEWKTGDHLWMIDVVTPFGGLKEVLANLHGTKFANQPSLRYLWPNPAKQEMEVRHFQAPSGSYAGGQGMCNWLPKSMHMH